MSLEPMPASYPAVSPETRKRRRAVFSQGFRELDHHHAAPPTQPLGEEERRHRVRQDDSLRLIEDLTNRPVDPMFSDSRLGRAKRTPLGIWTTRVVVFLVCIAVGLAGSVLVRQLRTDPRKEVRLSMASQLGQTMDEVTKLTGEVTKLQSDITKRSDSLGAGPASRAIANDSLGMGLTKVHGPGVDVTLADPLSATTGNDKISDKLRVVTDTDLQQIVSLLWQSGAEAIAINGHRLGPQTSIRTAGGSILVGLEAVESPYQITAVGDKDGMADALKEQTELSAAFKQAGITLRTKRVKDITLEAAVSGDIRYARKVE